MNKSAPYPLKQYVHVLAGLSLSGVVISIYLSLSHYHNFTDMGYRSFCAISQAVNCDTVSQSKYAVFLKVPLGVWGVLGYLSLGVLMMIFFPGKDNKSLQGWAGGIFVLAFFFSLVSLWLAMIAILNIKSYCLMCIVLYGVNFALLYVSWLVWKRTGEGTLTGQMKNNIIFFRTRITRLLLTGTGVVIAGAMLVLFYPKYWLFPELDFETTVVVGAGITEDGSPWIGAENPVLTIEEYGDYMCFQCGKMHGYLRQLVSQYPDRIRLVHRHFPLDNKINPVVKEDIHPNSRLISLFAIMAQDEGQFWPVNDLLFRDAREKGTIQLADIGKQAHLDMSHFPKKMGSKKYVVKLQKDIREGLSHGITATPSYVIDGKVYAGIIPEHILRSALP